MMNYSTINMKKETLFKNFKKLHIKVLTNIKFGVPL